MAGESVADNPWAAAACWVGALFSGGLVPLILLIVTWKDRGSLTRRHALAATALWAVLMATYIPVFFLGMFLPAFQGEAPRSWAVAVAVAFFVISWGAAVVGVAVVLRSARRGPTRDRVGERPAAR